MRVSERELLLSMPDDLIEFYSNLSPFMKAKYRDFYSQLMSCKSESHVLRVVNDIADFSDHLGNKSRLTVQEAVRLLLS